MRSIFLTILLFRGLSFWGQTVQPERCTPQVEVKTFLCSYAKDSLSGCPDNWHRLPGLITNHEAYQIVGFTLTAFDLCDEEKGDVYETVSLTGEFSPYARMILSKACKGSTLMFSCIKAKHRNGKIYFVQPLTVKL